MITVKITCKEFKGQPFDFLETKLPEQPQIGDLLDFSPLLGGDNGRIFVKDFILNDYLNILKITSKTWQCFSENSILILEGELLKNQVRTSVGSYEPKVY